MGGDGIIVEIVLDEKLKGKDGKPRKKFRIFRSPLSLPLSSFLLTKLNNKTNKQTKKTKQTNTHTINKHTHHNQHTHATNNTTPQHRRWVCV
jgi:hypothetical protein